ncbi:ABC transporter permease subunit [Paenibacillus chitinolyticus]|uniref:ABC transporter permease subunit n=1 Tax=Paenibacillus chitinolyticus TaxID=79263 RepID=UPI001C43C51C|nr:ABC transporter permease subunit [Paenibacillus chitinolyticus]
MHRWKAGYVNELYLLLYRKKFGIFGAVSVLLPILFAVSLQALEPLLGLMAVSGSFPVQTLGFYTALWVPLFILTLTGDQFPHEVASRTLKLAFLRPNTRFHVFTAKVAAQGTAVAVLLALLFAVTLLCAMFTGTPLGLAEGLSAAKAYAAAFAAMLALSAVFVFAAQFFKSASGFVVFGIVLYAAAKLAPFLVQSFPAFSPVSYTDWHLLWLNDGVPAGRRMTAALFLLSSSLLFFALGYYKFDRKEV